MKIAGSDDWDNIALAVCHDFSFIKIVEINNWIFTENIITAMQTTNPFKPNETAVIYPAEDIFEDFAIALSKLYDYFPELHGNLTVFDEDTIIEKIKIYEGFFEIFGNHEPEKLIYRYRATIKDGIYTITQNTRG